MTTLYSGERLTAIYHLTGNETEARAKAQDLTLEQTVELPDALVTDPTIRANIIGRIDELTPIASDLYSAEISFSVETIGDELTQLINVIFGNISIKPGIRLERIELPPSLLKIFHGPRFGRVGLREFLNVPERPLLCTALKPMGLSVEELADLAYQLALGGIDIIKDDHGLANQPFAPFEERVVRCAEAVARANQDCGGHSVYAPNITAPFPVILERARFAKQHGAGALLICPGITGLDTMRALADDDEIALPILSHPAFQGSYIADRTSGISHFCLFGQLNRLAGADAAIFPNAGGRFFFTKQDCRALVDGCSTNMGTIAPIFPTPAGGMGLQRVPEMRAMYGRDVILLVGGGLRSHSPDLVANCNFFRELAEKM
ncbi:MAG TPA: RuBisCO large subunit C-terminal-like domain-containing protein [Anaerolineae bacterium]|nr:RuBisCO large subunit C-terminal-like domain-containing protein [Anaerolineae bacterium]